MTQPLRLAGLLGLALAGLLVGPGAAYAQGAAEVYVRRDECIAGGRLSAEQCEFAYRNARAAFEQDAPRYASRAACERAHKRCGAQVSTSGGWDALARGGGAASYVPRFAGIRVTGEGASAKAAPVVEGKAVFAGRRVDALDERISGRRGVIGAAPATGRAGQGGGGGFVSRGDRDDTVRVPMQQKRIGADVAPGLYVDPDGVEWYKPARRR